MLSILPLQGLSTISCCLFLLPNNCFFSKGHQPISLFVQQGQQIWKSGNFIMFKFGPITDFLFDFHSYYRERTHWLRSRKALAKAVNHKRTYPLQCFSSHCESKRSHLYGVKRLLKLTQCCYLWLYSVFSSSSFIHNTCSPSRSIQ